MDNDSSDVTSSGRSFQVRGPTTGKARLVTVVNLTRRYYQTIGIGTSPLRIDEGCMDMVNVKTTLIGLVMYLDEGTRWRGHTRKIWWDCQPVREDMRSFGLY